MSRRPWVAREANALAECSLATLECDLLQCSSFATREQAQTKVLRFLEGFYNRRHHSALGCLSPVEFERKAARN